MRDETFLDDSASVARRSRRRSRPHLVVIAALVTAVISVAVCVGAILAPAPPAVVPLVVVICVGCPVFAAWDVPVALDSLRANRAGKALATLRRSLDQLPETEHPFGF
jgi:hypothetical protein